VGKLFGVWKLDRQEVLLSAYVQCGEEKQFEKETLTLFCFINSGGASLSSPHHFSLIHACDPFFFALSDDVLLLLKFRDQPPCSHAACAFFFFSLEKEQQGTGGPYCWKFTCE